MMRDVSMTGASANLAEMDHDWRAVVAAAIGLIFSAGTLTIYSFGMFVHPLHAQFGWTQTLLGGAIAISQLGLAVASPLWSAAIERLGPLPPMPVLQEEDKQQAAGVPLPTFFTVGLAAKKIRLAVR